MSRINETRHIIWHETCKFMCRLTSSVCNSRQRWNKDKCRCACGEDLIDNEICDKGSIYNPSTCECECDKSCGIREYLDYKNCVCRSTLIDKLVEECTNVIGENNVYNDTLNTIPSDDCASCALYGVVFAVLTGVITGSSFVYFHWCFKKRCF